MPGSNAPIGERIFGEIHKGGGHDAILGLLHHVPMGQHRAPGPSVRHRQQPLRRVGRLAGLALAAFLLVPG
jgi:hypothetical protein